MKRNYLYVNYKLTTDEIYNTILDETHLHFSSRKNDSIDSETDSSKDTIEWSESSPEEMEDHAASISTSEDVEMNQQSYQELYDRCIDHLQQLELTPKSTTSQEQGSKEDTYVSSSQYHRQMNYIRKMKDKCMSYSFSMRYGISSAQIPTSMDDSSSSLHNISEMDDYISDAIHNYYHYLDVLNSTNQSLQNASVLQHCCYHLYTLFMRTITSMTPDPSSYLHYYYYTFLMNSFEQEMATCLNTLQNFIASKNYLHQTISLLNYLYDFLLLHSPSDCISTSPYVPSNYQAILQCFLCSYYQYLQIFLNSLLSYKFASTTTSFSLPTKDAEYNIYCIQYDQRNSSSDVQFLPSFMMNLMPTVCRSHLMTDAV